MMTMFGIFLTILFGLLISLLIIPKMFSFERVGVSYVLGLGLLTFVMFIEYLLGINFSLNSSLSSLLILILILFIFAKKRIMPFLTELKNDIYAIKLNKIEKIIVFVLCLLFVFSLICTLYWPVGAWDSLVLYDWRAKLFVANGNMDEGIIRGYFFGVPLLTSLAHTWVYFLGSKQPEFIYSLFFVSFILMFYGSLREFSKRLLALFTVLLLSTTPDVLIHSTFSYTNFPFTIYFVMSTIYMYIWMVKEKRGYLVLSAILLGLSAWTRSSEPFWIINIIVLIIFSLYKKKIFNPIVFVGLFFALRQPWVIFENSKLEYSTTVSSKISEGIGAVLQNINVEHIVLVAKFLYDNVFAGLATYLIGFTFILTWGIRDYLKEKNYWLWGMVIGYLMLIVIGTYAFSLTFNDWKIGGSAARMVMFIPPITMFFFSSSAKLNKLYESWSKKK